MIRFTFKVLLACVFNIFLLSCISKFDVSGRWIRLITDESLGIKGVEYIEFSVDSSFIIENRLRLCREDSLIKCNLDFKSGIQGSWVLRNDTIRMTYDLLAYRFEADPGSFLLETINKNYRLSVDPSTLRKELCDRLADYYEAVYAEVSENGMILSEVWMEGDSLLNALNNGVKVTWTKR